MALRGTAAVVPFAAAASLALASLVRDYRCTGCSRHLALTPEEQVY